MARPTRESDEGAEAKPLGPEITHIDDKPSADDVLLYNARAGIYTGHLSQVIVALSTDRQQRHDMRTLTLAPGLNYAPRDLFEKLSAQPGLARRIEAGEIVEVRSFAHVSPAQAIAWVKHTASVPSLQRIRETEGRDAVLEAIDEQIRLAKDDKAATGRMGRRASA